MQNTILVPPLNFALAAPDVYRSGFPNKKKYSLLTQLQVSQKVEFKVDNVFIRRRLLRGEYCIYE
jgi:tyrosine-protein phosphatase SIW14